MQKATFAIDEYNTCVECAIALRRFIGALDGVESIDDLRGMIIVSFDETKIDREWLIKITTDSIRKLGY
jgi:hypothetical protein